MSYDIRFPKKDADAVSPKGSDVADDRTWTTQDNTIHYISPASVTTLHGEDFGYGADAYLRYLHAPGSGFGEYSQSSAMSSESLELIQLERTCAIIKPEAVIYEDVVLRKLHVAGFKIIQKRRLHLTPEQVSELYAHLYGEVSFPYLVVSMSAAPVVVLCLAAVGAVSKWKDLVKGTGRLPTSWFWPKSMRIRFGVQQSMENALHFSEDIYSANREIRYFFPRMILEPLLQKEDQVTDYLSLKVNPTILDGLTELCKLKPIEPIMYFAEWLLLNNPFQPKMKPEIAKLPT